MEGRSGAPMEGRSGAPMEARSSTPMGELEWQIIWSTQHALTLSCLLTDFRIPGTWCFFLGGGVGHPGIQKRWEASLEAAYGKK
jgi:hypothetical protein